MRRNNGMLEWWNLGRMGCLKTDVRAFPTIPLFHYSTIPTFPFAVTGNAKTLWRAAPKHRTPDASLNLF
jgi:hypothetical protein